MVWLIHGRARNVDRQASSKSNPPQSSVPKNDPSLPPPPPDIKSENQQPVENGTHRPLYQPDVEFINSAVLELITPEIVTWEKANSVLLRWDKAQGGISYYLPKFPQELRSKLLAAWQAKKPALVAQLQLDEWGQGYVDRVFRKITEFERPNLVVTFTLDPDEVGGEKDLVWRDAVGSMADVVVRSSGVEIVRKPTSPPPTSPSDHTSMACIPIRAGLDQIIVERFSHLISVEERE